MPGRDHEVSSVGDQRFVEWARRIRESDTEAFRSLFEAVHVDLLRFAWRYTFDEEAARDLVQDALLKLWQIRQSIDEHRSLRALLYTMVRNRALNHRRARQEIDSSSKVDGPWEPEGDDRLEDRTDADLLEGRLLEWIEKLPDRRREAFVLSRFHGMTHDEIASLMGLTPRTVNTHIVLALKELRQRMDAVELHDRS